MIVRLLGWLRRGRGGDAAKPRHLRHGEWGEDEAVRLLKGKGYRIIGRRVRVTRRDELDVVARDGDTLVFVEVKMRAGEAYGRPLDAVDRAKRKVLSRAAGRYLQRLKRPPEYFRFDVVEVVGRPGEGRPVLRHLERAFTLEEPYRVFLP